MTCTTLPTLYPWKHRIIICHFQGQCVSFPPYPGLIYSDLQNVLHNEFMHRWCDWQSHSHRVVLQWWRYWLPRSTHQLDPILLILVDRWSHQTVCCGFRCAKHSASHCIWPEARLRWSEHFGQRVVGAVRTNPSELLVSRCESWYDAEAGN
jgi:hypothetical protein